MRGHAAMRVAFLLGSGASRPAGIPSTEDLTRAILAGDGYARYTDGSYFGGQPLYAHLGEPDSHVPHISRFLRWLTCHVSPYYERSLGRTPTYEDLYYLVEQIYAEEVGDLDNPLVLDAQRDIRPRLCDCAERVSPTSPSGPHTSVIALETLNYIASVVAAELASPHDAADYLNFIEEARQSSNSARLSVFTLNHDLLIEQFLSRRNVRVIDGFGEPINSVRYWNPDLFSVGDVGCVVLKLHGSIRWFRFGPDGGGWSDERIGLPLTADIQHTTGPNDQPQRAVDWRPLMLIGTFNKILEYTGGVFSDLFEEFRRQLEKTDALVVCGYGFGDKGINGQLIQWLYRAHGRRILVVHPQPDKLRDAARGAVRNKWDTWLENGTLCLCESRAEQITWAEMAAAIGSS